MTRPVLLRSASKMARQRTSSMVMGFSVMTSFPASRAPMMYRWWVASTLVTITASQSTFRIISSKSVNTGSEVPTSSFAASSRFGFVSHRPTTSATSV